jgi:hypothetical protein
MVIDFIEKNFDDYNRKARLSPALLVSLPFALTALSFFPDDVWSWGGLLGLLSWFGLLKLLAQLARDMGKIKEEELYSAWNGKPTTYFLQHRTAKNKVNLARQHNKLNQLTGQSLPSEQEELADPDLADQIYDTCVQFLLAKTRDHSKFSLIYEENCNYGFRRNLLGMKPLGITISCSGIVILGLQYLSNVQWHQLFENWKAGGLSQFITHLQLPPYPPLSLACLLFNIFLIVAWSFWINPDWVKRTAEAYAIRLLEASEGLP